MQEIVLCALSPYKTGTTVHIPHISRGGISTIGFVYIYISIIWVPWILKIVCLSAIAIFLNGKSNVPLIYYKSSYLTHRRNLISKILQRRWCWFFVLVPNWQIGANSFNWNPNPNLWVKNKSENLSIVKSKRKKRTIASSYFWFEAAFELINQSWAQVQKTCGQGFNFKRKIAQASATCWILHSKHLLSITQASDSLLLRKTSGPSLPAQRLSVSSVCFLPPSTSLVNTPTLPWSDEEFPMLDSNFILKAGMGQAM